MSHGECIHLVSYYKDCPDCKKEEEEKHQAKVESYKRYLRGEKMDDNQAFERLEKLRALAFELYDSIGVFGSLRSDLVLKMIFGIEDKKPLSSISTIISKPIERYR